MINVTTATTTELVSFFNEHSATPVKKFQDRATAERRVTAIIKLLEEGFSQKPADDELAANASQHGASSVLADELGSEDPANDEVNESNQEPIVDPMPVKAPDPAKVHEAALRLFSILTEDKAAEAFRKVLNKFPEITRVQFKHTASAAGHKPLTARNAFDRIRGVP